MSTDQDGHQYVALHKAPLVTEYATPVWPKLSPKALPGIVGDFIELATENSEADPAAVLATFLVRFAAEVGSGPVFMVGDSKHRAILAGVVVGASSKSRKGTSGKPVIKCFQFPEGHHIPAKTTPGPFSSGEGIINAVRDKVLKWDAENQEEKVIDPGVDDKRLFVLDEEFGGVMANSKREGNTLSMIIRTSWDSGNIEPLIKNNRTGTTGAHICWVSHITLNELNTRLPETEALNGFANRILWICARRQKEVALPTPMDTTRLAEIQERLILLAEKFKEEIVITFDEEAKSAWCNHYYSELTKDRPGVVGCVTNRAEAQVVRLAMVYCLLDGKTCIELAHLESAIAFWDYCFQSAKYVFHGRVGDNIAQKILDALDTKTMTGTDVNRLFGSNINKGRIEVAIAELLAADMIIKVVEPTKGRPITRYEKKNPVNVRNVLNVLTPTSPTEKELNTLNTFKTSGKENKAEVHEL